MFILLEFPENYSEFMCYDIHLFSKMMIPEKLISVSWVYLTFYIIFNNILINLYIFAFIFINILFQKCLQLKIKTKTIFGKKFKKHKIKIDV